MTTTTTQLDWLADKIIAALETTDMAQSWIQDKKREYTGKTRLEIMRSLSNFDSDNLNAICESLDVTHEDMQTTLSVLSKL